MAILVHYTHALYSTYALKPEACRAKSTPYMRTSFVFLYPTKGKVRVNCLDRAANGSPASIPHIHLIVITFGADAHAAKHGPPSRKLSDGWPLRYSTAIMRRSQIQGEDGRGRCLPPTLKNPRRHVTAAQRGPPLPLNGARARARVAQSRTTSTYTDLHPLRSH